MHKESNNRIGHNMPIIPGPLSPVFIRTITLDVSPPASLAEPINVSLKTLAGPGPSNVSDSVLQAPGSANTWPLASRVLLGWP